MQHLPTNKNTPDFTFSAFTISNSEGVGTSLLSVASPRRLAVTRAIDGSGRDYAIMYMTDFMWLGAIVNKVSRVNIGDHIPVLNK